jgi:triacylglycerol lipase
MTMRRFRAVAGLLGAATIGITVVAGAHAAGASSGQLPVPYDFTVSAVSAGVNAYADPPGANDWSCRPSAAHPEPIVLVHGTAGNKNTNWQTYAPLLHNNGYCVYALTYGVLPGAGLPLDQFGGLGLIENSAAELSVFVDKVLAATGAAKVDIVGHSQGTLMPDYYAKFLGGASKIDKYVSLAPLWHGTDLLGTAQLATAGRGYGFPVDDPSFGAGSEMLQGSPFMLKMRAGGVAVPGITYTNIVSQHDELVVPYTSGIEPGMTNIVLQDACPLDLTDHFEIVADPIASVDVLNALDPAHPRPVPCQVVLPFIGG